MWLVLEIAFGHYLWLLIVFAFTMIFMMITIMLWRWDYVIEFMILWWWWDDNNHDTEIMMMILRWKRHDTYILHIYIYTHIKKFPKSQRVTGCFHFSNVKCYIFIWVSLIICSTLTYVTCCWFAYLYNVEFSQLIVSTNIYLMYWFYLCSTYYWVQSVFYH